MAVAKALWATRAACFGSTIMFPTHRREEPPAKAICQDCPVRIDCLENALVFEEPDGVWGGFSEAERVSLRRTFKQQQRRSEWDDHSRRMFRSWLHAVISQDPGRVKQKRTRPS